jgi:hypothetical protein
MAFPIIPKKRSGATGNPSSLNLGELAVNTFTGELFLGADGGVTLINGPVAGGTTTTETTGDGTTTAFTFSGYNGTADGGYLVSVGGIDQPPSKYSVSSTAGGTLTFVEAPTDGELISIRAIVAGGGGGGSGDATSIQGVDVATTAPTNGQVLAYNSTTDKWEPQGGGGSVTFDTVGTHLWSVPASVRYASVSATAGDGGAGTAGTNGAAGATGANAYYDDILGYWINPTTGANGANGEDGVDGSGGKNLTLSAIALALTGGSGGAKGLGGFGGGGSGGGGAPSAYGAAGAAGNGPTAGSGGMGGGGESFGGAAGGGTATAGTTGLPGSQGLGGTGDLNGGAGGNGGFGGSSTGGGGGGGGGYDRSGGGGGGGSSGDTQFPGPAGTPGFGGTGTQGTAGTAGQTFNGAANFSAYAGGQVAIVISEGAGNASITITY